MSKYFETLWQAVVTWLVICSLIGGLMFFILCIAAVFSDNATITLTNNTVKKVFYDN